jgi:alpha-methylacyl-CoA racemase
MSDGPLAGVRVIEMDAIGPVPFCAMLLADMGADVVRVARPQTDAAAVERPDEVTRRGRRFFPANLKTPEGQVIVRRLGERADILIEGSRPGVMERLGLGPKDLRRANPRLVYGRMTGWGQTGPLASTAGHDINYTALSGALHAIGRAGDRPVPPLNLVGDYGGGALFLAFGVVCALWEARRSGEGQVVDAAMVDGSASLMALFGGLIARGAWREERGVNLLDGGAPWYDTYETADGRHVAVGALEEPFWQALLFGLDLEGRLPSRTERENWPTIRARFAEAFRMRTRDEWAAHFAGTDACVTPVLATSEARTHPHNAAREVFVTLAGVAQPAPAPRFSRTPGRAAPPSSTSFDEIIAEWSVERAA